MTTSVHMNMIDRQDHLGVLIAAISVLTDEQSLFSLSTGSRPRSPMAPHTEQRYRRNLDAASTVRAITGEEENLLRFCVDHADSLPQEVGQLLELILDCVGEPTSEERLLNAWIQQRQRRFF